MMPGLISSPSAGCTAGKRPARVGPEFISIDDYHGLIQMLIISITQLDSSKVPSLLQRMEELHRAHRDVLQPLKADSQRR